MIFFSTVGPPKLRYVNVSHGPLKGDSMYVPVVPNVMIECFSFVGEHFLRLEFCDSDGEKCWACFS